MVDDVRSHRQGRRAASPGNDSLAGGPVRVPACLSSVLDSRPGQCAPADRSRGVPDHWPGGAVPGSDGRLLGGTGMKVTLWGTRGSLPSPGPETARYGGNTSCVEVRGANGQLLILDAGTGIRSLSATLDPELRRVDVLLTHLHMDHVQGLGFFAGLYKPGLEVHVWGPPSTTLHLRDRLARYLSPPLFPVQMRDLPSRLMLHDVPLSDFEIEGMGVKANLVCHPGPTVGYRISENGKAMGYLADHEPALRTRR